MASLTNQKISNSYLGLLNTTSNGVLTSSLAQITDGNGNGSPIYLSTAALNLYNKYTFPDAVPASGTFLKATDGSGTLAWVAESGGDVKKTGTITINTIAVWNDATETLRSDPAMSIVSNTISLLQKNSSGTDTTSYNIGGGNIANVTGTSNVGFGSSNMQSVTTGNNNTAFGSSAIGSLTIGSENTGIGNSSLFDCNEGDNNTGVGSSSLANVTTGDDNTAVGHDAGLNVSTGSYNTFIGTDAGRSTTGSTNTFLGNDSGTSVSSGSKNVILGSNNGSTIATSNNNIIISDGDGNNRLQFASTGAATFTTNSNSSIVNHFTNSDTTDASTRNTIELTAGNRFLQLQAYNADHVYLNRSSSSDLYFQHNGTTQQIFKSGGQVEFKNYLSIEPAVAGGTSSFIQFKNDTSLFAYIGSAAAILSGAAADYVAGNTYTNASVFLATNNTERLKIVGTGEATFTAPNNSDTLTIKNTGTYGGTIAFTQGASTNIGYIGSLRAFEGNATGDNGIGMFSRDRISFYTDSSTPDVTISSGGNLGIGTSSPDDVNGTSLSSHTNLQVFSTSNAAHLIANGGVNGSLLLNDSGATANSRLWRVMSDGGVFSINALTDATSAKHNTLEISEGGNVAINNTPFASGQLFVHGYDSSTTFTFILDNSGGVGTFFVRNNGEISTGGAASSPKNNTTSSSANAFIDSSGILLTSSSSKRFKNTITDATHGLSDVLKLRSVTYKSNNTKIDGDRLYGGFIAEEVEDLGLKEFVDYDDNDEPKSIHYANMVSLLTKAMQEQQVIINDLKSRIEKLEK